jgi:NAD-dependent DNA ligase
MLDPRIVAKRPLEIVLYGVGRDFRRFAATQERLLAWLQELGFRTPKFTRLCSTVRSWSPRSRSWTRSAIASASKRTAPC